MFFPGTFIIFVRGDSVFMLLKCMCNNISIEKKRIKKRISENSSRVRINKTLKDLFSD